MIIRRRGIYPAIDSKSIIQYLDNQIEQTKKMQLEAESENDKNKLLICEGAIVALQNTKENILYSIDN